MQMAGNNNCNDCNSNRRKEIACAPFGTAHGPSTPGCDAYFKGQCSHYQMLTRGLGSRGSSQGAAGCSCFNENFGEQYICPKVGQAGQGAAGCKGCHNLKPSNLGEHYICGGSLTQAGMGPSKGQDQVQEQVQEQTGGGDINRSPLNYSSFNAPDYNSCDGCVIPHRNDLGDGPKDYNLANYTDCAGSRVKVRTNYLPSAQCGRDFSTVREQDAVPVPGYKEATDTPLMCNGRERCGNGLCSRPLCSNNQGVPGKDCCKRANLATSCFQDANAAQARKSPWVYGSQDIPSYHLDLSGPIVGGRPQWRRGTNNSVPPMMLKNTINLPGRKFDCRQPCWGPECM